jgi:class 3 adenylate cyclase
MVWSFAVAALGGAALAVIAFLYALSLRRNTKLKQELGSAYDSIEQLQLSFNRFVPWQLVDQLADKGSVPEAAEREVTVLFADLRGFTGICESLSPQQTIELLNRYYSAVSAAITQNRGHVSKYIGDGVLGLFGALEYNPWQVNDAVHTALKISANVRSIEVSDLFGSDSPLSPSVGVHHGKVIAGVTGSGDLLEFTVLGNTVNLAARVEALTRIHDVDILVTDAVRSRLDPGFILTAQPRERVKGISEPLITYAVEGYSKE